MYIYILYICILCICIYAHGYMYNSARLVGVKCVVGEVELSFWFTDGKVRGITVFHRRLTWIDTIGSREDQTIIKQSLGEKQSRYTDYKERRNVRNDTSALRESNEQNAKRVVMYPPSVRQLVDGKKVSKNWRSLVSVPRTLSRYQEWGSSPRN